MVHKLNITYLPLDQLKHYDRDLKKHSQKQIDKTARILNEYGFVQPIVINANNVVVLGTNLVEAAQKLGLEKLPTIKLEHLSEEDLRIIRIAYQRIAEEAEWDKSVLKIELEELKLALPELDLELTGFDIPEIDMIMNFDPGEETDPNDVMPDEEDIEARVAIGDLWQLGDHLLYCGDALKEESYKSLLNDESVQMVFTDAPYNVKINGHVGNSGKIKHDEFAMASGEMSDDEFTQFLTQAHKHIEKSCNDGAIIYSCMDWRHLSHMLSALDASSLSLKNLCVWNKGVGGMGSLYRSQHELIFVAKKGKAKHINNVELGKHGRNRTNVWDYDGVNGYHSKRQDELKLHPTVKPIQMVADAMLDCSNPDGIILDPFGGSGTTLLAAEKTNRKARLIELSPHYCDVTIKRWEDMTGQKACLINDKKSKKKEA